MPLWRAMFWVTLPLISAEYCNQDSPYMCVYLPIPCFLRVPASTEYSWKRETLWVTEVRELTHAQQLTHATRGSTLLKEGGGSQLWGRLCGFWVCWFRSRRFSENESQTCDVCLPISATNLRHPQSFPFSWRTFSTLNWFLSHAHCQLGS